VDGEVHVYGVVLVQVHEQPLQVTDHMLAGFFQSVVLGLLIKTRLMLLVALLSTVQLTVLLDVFLMTLSGDEVTVGLDSCPALDVALFV